MSNYSIPFVRTNINSTSTTSLPYVTNPVRIRPISITSSNTVPITITLNHSTRTFNSTTNVYTDSYVTNQSGNISFSNFNIPNITSFSKPLITFNTSSSLPTGISVSYSNITNTGFTYTLSGTSQVISWGQQPASTITHSGSITYTAST